MNPDSKTLALHPFPAELIHARMQEVLLVDNHEIDNIIKYLTENSGKMLRPRMVYLAASMAPHDPAVVRDAAVAVELIHMASLVHDDVIDHAMVRRGKESLNKRWGNHISILTGDYLFATAFNLINQHGMQAIMENVTTTIRIMCTGEIKQMSLAHDVTITEEKYLEKTFGKTACLFASSCKVGALAASMPGDKVSALEQYGLCLGYAYQILDDLLDFMSDSEVLGKPAGTDLLEGNITLPVIHALRSTKYGIWLRTLLESGIIAQNHIPQVVEALVDSQAISASLQTARQFIARGLDSLKGLPPGPALKELEYLAAYLLENYYQKLSKPKEQVSQEAAQ
ncbi:MAG: polyprenyl synthetase family protein [Syntrophomonadaceae bacterium]|nr:polyprenyl synthetase family protein [Syntrophomonadaceae bacterium]